jgi:DNA helicase II / ATP-dependent DNA helicase PcrA
MPTLQEDPECQVYLEVIARAISQTSRLNRFRSRIVFDPAMQHASVTEAIRNIFVPLSIGDLALNEEIIQTLPRSAINFLTVHQAKGLEYPVVIVDVAAHFPTNHQGHRRMRFPEQIEEVHIAEDQTRTFGGLNGVTVPGGLNRAFDDLVRLYYVAFSRPQALLILAGVNPALPSGNIRNVALGWTRTGVSRWRPSPPFISL